MNELAEGTWPCTVISGEAGETKPGVVVARITVRFDDGPSKGRTGTYEDEVNAKSALYVSRSMKAVGWTGKSIGTFAGDVAAWIARTGGKSTAEVKHIEIKRGKQYDKWVAEGCPEEKRPIWDKVNSIGRGPRALAAPKPSTLVDADDALRAAMIADGTEADSEPVATEEAPF
jgi:hypothetical protein